MGEDAASRVVRIVAGVALFKKVNKTPKAKREYGQPFQSSLNARHEIKRNLSSRARLTADVTGFECTRLEGVQRVTADGRNLLRECESDLLVNRGSICGGRVLEGSRVSVRAGQLRAKDVRTWCCWMAAISGFTALMLVQGAVTPPTVPELRSRAR